VDSDAERGLTRIKVNGIGKSHSCGWQSIASTLLLFEYSGCSRFLLDVDGGT